MTIQLRGTESDQLIRMAHANVERSQRLIGRAKIALGRCAAFRRAAAEVHPECRVRKERRNDSSVQPGIKKWLLAIESVIKDWHAMPKDEIGATVAEATPAEAAA